MPLVLFRGFRPFDRNAVMRDVFAGVTLASMNIPQVLGYARIAGMPVVTGLYTVLLPLVRSLSSVPPDILSYLPIQQRPLSSPVHCHVWRCLQARSTLRWPAWWHC
jgi:hypothetical protein